MNELGLPMDGEGGRRRGEGGMEQNELEEGGTCSGQEDFVDPDAHSYIDEKIQHVLGHFQKKFHSGASLETMGAQFGGYGSFLPSYLRFPAILSQAKSPVKMPNYNVSRSPYNSHPKDGHHSPSVPGTTPVTKVSIISTGKLIEMPDERKEITNTQISEGIVGEQKILKFRINVGHNNDLNRSKPDLYGDLGLDISSSSVEDSPNGCEKCSPESVDAFLESPTTILQIMTSFPGPGGYLSPLPDSLLHPNGNYEILHTKGRTEAYAASSGTSPNVKFIRSSTCKKGELNEKSQMPKKADELLGDMVAVLKKEPQGFITADHDISHSSRARFGAASKVKPSKERPTSSHSQKKIFRDLDNASLRNDSAERTGNSRPPATTKEKTKSKVSRKSDTTMADSSSCSGRKSHASKPKKPVYHNFVQKASSSAELCMKDLNPSPPVTSKGKMEMLGAPKSVKEDNKNNVIKSRNGFGVAPLNYNSQTSNSLAAISASVIKESWVLCDLCQTWRLLPYGTNTKNLPTKWQCSMQVWLPRLNKCYIGEDETTKAFHELYQAPTPVNITDFTLHPDTAESNIPLSDTLNHNARLENKAFNAPLGGKRRHVSMKVSNLPIATFLKEGPSRSAVSCPNEGALFGKDSRLSKSKGKRKVDLDGYRSSKKSGVKLQEPRDSSIESVSSSLMRILNTTNNSKNLLAKDDEVLNTRLLNGSSKSNSDGHVAGCSDQSGTMAKDTTSLRISKTSKTANTGFFMEQTNKSSAFDREEYHNFDHKMSANSSSQCRDSKKVCTSSSKKRELKILDSYSDLNPHPNRADNVENCSKQHRIHDSSVIATGRNHTDFISQENLHQDSSHRGQDHSSQIIVDRLEGGSENMIQMASASVKETNSKRRHVDAMNGDASKSAKQLKKSSSSAPKCSPMKKDGHTAVNVLVQEARELKHAADHLKHEELEHDSSGILFEASLKFLLAASLMEPPNTENVGREELFPSLQMYLETAQLCEFCACKYENLKEMAAAALAYKCAEVAYMKVAYLKDLGASKDRQDLQAALDAALLDESPSQSPSNVDNLTNQGGFEKAAVGKGTGSPQISSNLVIAGQNLLHVKRLLTYTNYLNSAFEAVRKSRNSLEAVSADLKKDEIRKVLDFNFNNVEGLLQLVRISLNSIIS